MFFKEKSKLLHIITPLFFILSLIVHLIFSPINIKQAKASISPIPNPSAMGFFSGIGKPNDIVMSPDGTKAYLASDPFGVVVMDISNTADPKVLGSQHPAGVADKLAVSGNIVVAAGTPRGTDIVDVTNPNYPIVLSSIESNSSDVAINGDFAYIVSLTNLKIVNIANPSDPQVTLLEIPGIATGVAISEDGNTAVVTAITPSNIYVLDISNPSSPTITGTETLGGIVSRVEISGNLALIKKSNPSSMQVVDVSIPSSPKLVNTIAVGSVNNMTVRGNIIYVSLDGEGLIIVDISDPENPLFLLEYSLASLSNTVSGNTVLSIQANNGLTMLDISDIANPTIVGSLVTGSYKANSISVGSLSSGKTVVIATGTPRGTDIIDVSNPKQPEILVSIDIPSIKSAINGDFAYIVSDNNLKIVNIANPSNPQITSFEIPGFATDVAISEDGNTAVVTAIIPSNIYILDITDPSSPTIIGSKTLGGMAMEVAISGNLALIMNTNPASMQTVDISNPSSPELLEGSISLRSASDVTLSGNTAYVSDGKYGFKIIDISDPENPFFLLEYNLGSLANTVIGNIVLSVQAINGLTILDVSDVANPVNIIDRMKILGKSEDVVVYDNRIYIADDTAELVIMDLYHDTPKFIVTADKYNVSSGDEVTYTITTKNVSPNTLTNFNLTDPIPDGTTYIEGGTYSYGTNTVSWTIPEMAPDQTITETFKVSIN